MQRSLAYKERAAEHLLPKPLGQSQACEILGAQTAIGLDAETLEHGDQLAHMLRRMPRLAREQHVTGLYAEKGLNLLLA